jgi:hypothetical protein
MSIGCARRLAKAWQNTRWQLGIAESSVAHAALSVT